MNVFELLEHIAAWPTRLFVRNYVDFTGSMTTIQTELLEVDPHNIEGQDVAICGFHCAVALGEEPCFNGGQWSDPEFIRKYLVPRLEAHPQWLVPDQIVTVALLPEGVEFVAPPIGRLIAQHLFYASNEFKMRAGTHTFHRRLLGIVAESNKSKNCWELLT